MNDTKAKRIITSFEIGELKEPWLRWCEANNNGDSGDALRQVIRKLAHKEIAVMHSPIPSEETDVPAVKAIYKVEAVSEKKLKRGMEIRFTESEREALKARAAAEGFSTANQWVVALVRANLTETPQFGASEIAVLGESNHQLLAIGRNLNQIAKAMNSVKGDRDEYDHQLVDELAKAVRTHVKKVGDALRASIYRWKLK